MLFSLALSALALVFLFSAMVFANSDSDQIPDGIAESAVWFLLPSITVAGAFWAVREAFLALTEGRSLRRYPVGVAVAIIGGVGSYGYAWLLTG
jgi:hypothetical protein